MAGLTIPGSGDNETDCTLRRSPRVAVPREANATYILCGATVTVPVKVHVGLVAIWQLFFYGNSMSDIPHVMWRCNRVGNDTTEDAVGANWVFYRESTVLIVDAVID